MKPLDTIVFETPIVRAARFRCDATDPRFTDSGPAENCAVVFPRTSVWIRHAGSPPFVAGPSIATIYNPGQEYTRRLISQDGDRCEWFGVRSDLALEIVLQLERRSREQDRPFQRQFAPVDDRMYLAQRQLFMKLEGRRLDALEAEEAIIALVTAVVARAYEADGIERAKQANRYSDLVEAAKASIARSPFRRQSLDDLSSELGVSPFHLCRVFRQRTGSTIHGFRMRLRLRYALERLDEGSADLSRTALELGFSSHSHFTSAMRSRFGVTPSAVRNLLTSKTTYCPTRT